MSGEDAIFEQSMNIIRGNLTKLDNKELAKLGENPIFEKEQIKELLKTKLVSKEKEVSQLTAIIKYIMGLQMKVMELKLKKTILN